jgi:protein TonB
MYARRFENNLVQASARMSAPRLFAEFPRTRRSDAPRGRAYGIAGVAAVHGAVLAAALLLGGHFIPPARTPSVQVVTLPPDTVKPPPPPMTPQFRPPQTYVAAPIVPEITVDIPPAPKAIAIPPAPPQTAPAAPLVTASAQSPSTPGADARAAYLARLLTHLNAHKRYPESARRRRQQGTVSLRFTMDRAGRVLSFSVVKGSGARVLDDEARALIERAQPLPPIPPGFGQDHLDLVVPIEFYLR